RRRALHLLREASGRAHRIPPVRMIVVGIDPGTANTGYGVVARQGGRMVALDGGVVQTSPRSDPAARLAAIHARVCELLDELRPHAPCAGAQGHGRGPPMIALLSGEVAVRRPDHVVISCGGVGYRLAVSAETLRQVPAAGKPATLHTHLIVRDDALLLYGFATEAERDLFLLLIGVQSVGPKVALAVLSGGTPRELLAAVAAGDTARLQ